MIDRNKINQWTLCPNCGDVFYEVRRRKKVLKKFYVQSSLNM